jgi:ATP-binding cassette, subfamily B, bacterial
MVQRPGPEAKTERLTLKERILALSNLPRFFRLVWQTGPTIMIVNLLLRVIRSAMPVTSIRW